MKTAKDPRHLARRAALQTLFQWSNRTDLPQDSIYVSENSLNDISDADNEGESNIEMAQDLVKGVIDNQKQLDTIIEKCAPEWPISQISKVDANILRIAIFELLHRPDTPLKVAIDEAVELSKEFGSDSSSKFVNGVLGTVVKEHLKQEEKEDK